MLVGGVCKTGIMVLLGSVWIMALLESAGMMALLGSTWMMVLLESAGMMALLGSAGMMVFLESAGMMALLGSATFVFNISGSVSSILFVGYQPLSRIALFLGFT